MPPHSESLEQEGARIVAFKLVRDGKFQEEGITDILVNQEFGGSELYLCICCILTQNMICLKSFDCNHHCSTQSPR